MFPAKYAQVLKMSTGRMTALLVLVLVLLPFPVSIPLAMWLTDRHKTTNPARVPSTPASRKS